MEEHKGSPAASSMSLADFSAAYPLHPADTRMLFESVRYLSSSSTGWMDLTPVHVPEMQCYVLRGKSKRLQQQLRAQQRRREEEAAAAAAAPDSTAAAAVDPVPAIPSLLQPTPLPDWQYILPIESSQHIAHNAFSRFFSLLSTRSLLLALWTPPAYFTFLPLYAGIFSILPRSVLAKTAANASDEGDEAAEGEDGPLNDRQRVLQGGVEALLDGQIALDAPSSLSAPQPLLLSKRAVRKRKQAERNAQKGAFEDNTFNERNSAQTEEPMGKRHGSEALNELRRMTGVEATSHRSQGDHATAASFSSAAVASSSAASAAAPSAAPAGSTVPRRARRARQDE